MRTAVGLAAYLGVACRVERIRKGRPNPGLRPQHVAGLKALLKICRGEAEGLRVGSETLTFWPGPLKGGTIEVDIGTAGSVGLVLQTLMLPAAKVPSTLRLLVRGGTDVAWAPPVGYLQRVALPVLAQMGYRGELQLKRRGYYPKGGGEVLFVAEGRTLRGLRLLEAGRLQRVEGISHASEGLAERRVAERQREAAMARLRKEGIEAHIKIEYVSTASAGSGIELWAVFERTVLGANALGARGKRAEEVGNEAAEGLIRQISSRAALDEWMADQILPFLGVADGDSLVSFSRPSSHFTTNLWLMEQLPLGKTFKWWEEGGRGVLEVRSL